MSDTADYTDSERRALYLASRVLAQETEDADWLQWAVDVVMLDLELYDDPHYSSGWLLFADEEALAVNLGAELGEAVGENRFVAVPMLKSDGERWRSIRSSAKALENAIRKNGLDLPKQRPVENRSAYPIASVANVIPSWGWLLFLLGLAAVVYMLLR